LLIPYLRQGRYHGIDPNRWLIHDALRAELGSDVVRIKGARFSHNEDFDCGVFGKKFDFVIAQSIVTHCGPDLFRRLMASVADVLKEDGIFAFSYNRAEGQPTPTEGWHYPGVVYYGEQDVTTFVERARLIAQPIPWYHAGGASWYLAAHGQNRLPCSDELRLLGGAILPLRGLGNR
jgi:SAM-dependent methyltransferase